MNRVIYKVQRGSESLHFYRLHGYQLSTIEPKVLPVKSYSENLFIIIEAPVLM